ncbi:unnamed protein product, partial [Owenia fusiformis]
RGCHTGGESVAVKEVQFTAKGIDPNEETKLLQNLGDHNNLVKLFDFFTIETSVWIVMEYCDKGDLLQYFKKNKGNIDVALKVDFMYQMSLGVAHLHDARLVHRDLKPGNILLKTKDNKLVIKV